MQTLDPDDIPNEVKEVIFETTLDPTKVQWELSAFGDAFINLTKGRTPQQRSAILRVARVVGTLYEGISTMMSIVG